MGFRSALARWLQPGATPLPPAAAVELELERVKVRLDKLELERPAFVAELETMLEAVQDVLGRAESKRARATALESKARQRQEPTELEVDPNDREAVKGNVRRLLRAQGKIV